MKITCKTILLSSFNGTRLGVSLPAADKFVISRLTFADGMTATEIDWGDGTKETITGGTGATHQYAQGGDYEIKISDTIKVFGVTSGADKDWAAYVTSFSSNADLLANLESHAFDGCTNLTRIDLQGSGLQTFRISPFVNCSALHGVLKFPGLAKINGSATTQPFAGCTGGITEIHLPESSYASITSSSCYTADNTLGTGTATVKFIL